jgi:membrane fusion protein (multidrug efflux system)
MPQGYCVQYVAARRTVHPISMTPNLLYILRLAGLCIYITIFMVSCGKPPASGGPKGGFPVQAVVAPVIEGPIEETLFLVGNLSAREFIDIRSEVDAQITYIGFMEGAEVETDQVLFRLDDIKLQAQVQEAQARFDRAREENERGKVLVDRESISQQQFDQFRFEFAAAEAALRLARELMDDAIVRAPFDGRMDQRDVSLGQFVNTGQLLSSLVQTDPLEVEFNVPERYLGQLHEGQNIRISSVAWPDEHFLGEVYFVSPRLDERNRTITMKAIIDNADGRLKPGMFANLELVFEARPKALIIPEQAISYRGEQASVVVMGGDGLAEYRNIGVGLRISGAAEITSGLSAGEIVVVEGYQKIGPGTPILISPKSTQYGVTPPKVSVNPNSQAPG